MRTVPSGLATHLAGTVRTLAVCWRIERRDGELILGTEHDADIVVASGDLAGTYHAETGISGSAIESSSDMKVDNLEVEGHLDAIVSIVGLTEADVAAGLYDGARVDLFLCNWATPADGQVVIRHGTLGEIRRTSEGKFTAELRGLTQALTQTVIRTYSDLCDADLGDTRCGKDISALTVTATVTAVTSRRVFNCTLTGSGSAGDYVGGRLLGLTGDNTGYSREVKVDDGGSTLGHLELWEQMPRTVAIGDTFSLAPGCNKEFATCRDRFANALRFQGFGLYTPTGNRMVAGPDRGAGPV